MNNRKLTSSIDLFFCLVLLPVMALLLPLERWIANHLQFVIFFLFWLYTVYFINRKVTIPLVLRARRYFLAFIICSLMILVTFLISKYQFGISKDIFFNRGVFGQSNMVSIPFKVKLHEQAIWFLFIVVTTFSVSVGLFAELYVQTIEKKELEQQKTKAELALYKAQINPHFLFNTLNTLYGLILTRSDKTENAFMQFAGMMRYMYTNGTADSIPVSEEIEYIRQFIGIQENRLNGHTRVSFEVEVLDEKATIAPMLLITFVENAFKYGVSSSKDSTILIAIHVDHDSIRFSVRNTIFPETAKTRRKGKGIGIQNCRKRLDLLYGKDYVLRISDKDNYFDVGLTLNKTNL